MHFITNHSFVHYLWNGTLGTFVALLEAQLQQLPYRAIFGGFYKFLLFMSAQVPVTHLNPLLNYYRSYRQISTIGEMDSPTPKKVNSPLTQNQFRTLERILSNNWCLDATFSKWPQVSSMFKKKLFWKPIYWNQILNCVSKCPKRPAKKTLDNKKSWGYPPGRSPAAAAEAVYRFFTKSYHGSGRRQQSPLDGTTDSTLQ